MSEHIFARISGYHLTILPLAPFEYRQSADDDHLLILSHTTSSATKQASSNAIERPPNKGLGRTAHSANKIAAILKSRNSSTPVPI